jgi:uroporphyrinogen-III synthase
MSNIYLLGSRNFANTISIPLLKIEFLTPKIDIESFSNIIFTSKNGVKSINKITPLWRDKKIFTIAKQTANEVKKFGADVIYTADVATADIFADKIKKKLYGKTLYPRAKKVESNLFSILQNNKVDIKEFVTYKTSCNKSKIEIEQNSIIIFTSPSTIRCFLENYNWRNDLKAITIGEKTASFIPAHIQYKISDNTSIDSCIKLAKQMLKNS